MALRPVRLRGRTDAGYGSYVKLSAEDRIRRMLSGHERAADLANALPPKPHLATRRIECRGDARECRTTAMPVTARAVAEVAAVGFLVYDLRRRGVQDLRGGEMHFAHMRLHRCDADKEVERNTCEDDRPTCQFRDEWPHESTQFPATLHCCVPC